MTYYMYKMACNILRGNATQRNTCDGRTFPQICFRSMFKGIIVKFGRVTVRNRNAGFKGRFRFKNPFGELLKNIKQNSGYFVARAKKATFIIRSIFMANGLCVESTVRFLSIVSQLHFSRNFFRDSVKTIERS